MSNRTLTILGVVGLAAGTAWSQQPAPQPAPQGGQPQPGAVAGRPLEGTQVQAADADAARIQFEKMNHDFGKIGDEKEVETEFVFKNTGKKTLVMQQPTAGCGCTVPQLTKLEYAPGESGSIKVKFNPQGKHGQQNQRVTVRSNDPTQPELTLTISAAVKQKVWFEPPLVSFGEVQVGQPAKQVVKIHGPAPDFAVTYASSTKGRLFDIKVLETKEIEYEGEKVSQSTVEISYNGKAQRGTVQAMGLARTTLASHSLADFQITAEVVGDLVALPPRVNAGLLESGAPFSRPVQIRSRNGKPFKITKIDQQTNLPKQLEIKTIERPGSNGAEYNVELQGVAPDGNTPITGTITISTDSAVDPTLTIVLSGASRSRQNQPAAFDQGGPDGKPLPGAPAPGSGKPAVTPPADAPKPAAQPK